MRYPKKEGNGNIKNLRVYEENRQKFPMLPIVS
nr:MAG TPA: protein kinase [Caudoviricetes sp.]